MKRAVCNNVKLSGLLVLFAVTFFGCRRDILDLDPSNPFPPPPLVPVFIHHDASPDLVLASCDSLMSWMGPSGMYYVPSALTESAYDSIDLDLDADIDVIVYSTNWYEFHSNITPQSNYQRSIWASSPDSTVEFPKQGFPAVQVKDSLDTINANLSNWVPGCFLLYVNQAIPAGQSFYGVKYIPFRFVVSSGQYRYGWLRMQNFGILSGYQYYLTDWGYNQTPNLPILAGQY